MRNESEIEDAVFSIDHTGNRTDGFVVIDGLDCLVDDAVAHGEDGLVWIVVAYP